MRWDTVLRAVRAAALADPVLTGIYGTAIRLAGVGSLTVPVLQLMLVSDTEGEQWAPTVIQWDQWTESSAELLASEHRLRQLFHLEGPARIGGIVMWSQYLDGDSIGVPNRDGFLGRAIRFQYTPLRLRYDQTVTP